MRTSISKPLYPKVYLPLLLVLIATLRPVLVVAQELDLVQSGSVAEQVLQTVRERARDGASKPFVESKTNLSEALDKLSYDEYRAIRYKPARALWRGEAQFEVQPFHMGFIFKRPVKINTVLKSAERRPFLFSKDDFNYDEPAQFLTDTDFGEVHFAGFRVSFPLNTASYFDEVLTFQGASYFRLLSSLQAFGLSARGIAVNTAEPEGEEFPYFSEFWLIQPDTDANYFNIIALLESPSLTGAYQFSLSPGAPTELRVDAFLYMRKSVKKVGIAPLTSMFLQGENSVGKLDDYRPEIHDSDGLLFQTAYGEWNWRPLNNPRDLSVVSFSAYSPRGFGLLQRDTNFDHYQDVEARYEKRPGLWVVPMDDWGKGKIELVEIPTPSETNDNIVAYWVPEQVYEPNKEYAVSYVLKSVYGDFGAYDLAQVQRSANSWSYIPGSDHADKRDHRRFIVDFSSTRINKFDSDLPIKAEVSTLAGKIFDVNVQKLPSDQGWRASFQLDPDGAEMNDMRLYLTLRGKRISEVWNYVWSPRALN